MRMQLGRRADYAVRALVDLARDDASGRRRKAREIAEEMDIPRSYVPQILADLVRAGFVTSAAGPDGGYALAQAPEHLSLYDVVVAVDGEPASAECVLRGGPCRWDDVCAVHVPWYRAQQAMRLELAGVTFREIADNDAALEAGTYRVPEDLPADVAEG